MRVRVEIWLVSNSPLFFPCPVQFANSCGTLLSLQTRVVALGQLSLCDAVDQLGLNVFGHKK